MGISLTQLLIILVIVALIFGTKKLRNMGGDLGGAVKGFKNALNDDDAKNLKSDNAKDSGEVIDAKAEKVNDKNQ